MSEGVYRKTAADFKASAQADSSSPAEPTRITAVIQGGTIQVGYTPVAATLAASLQDKTVAAPTQAAALPTARTDAETTPGFTLAPPAPEPTAQIREAQAQADASVDPGDVSARVQDDNTADDTADEVPLARTGVHPAVPLGFLLLISLFGQALYWGEPMVASLRLVQLPIPVLLLAVVMIPFAFWLGQANDRWGPTPWLLGGTILIHTLATPFINAWLGGPGLGDVMLYHEYGAILLDTGMIPLNPAPEYPPLAVWIFGVITFLTAGVGLFPALSTAIVMAVPAFIMWLVLGRSRHGWMVAYIALMPWSAMWLVIRFDALPTALLVFALLLVRPDTETPWWKVACSAFIFGLAASAKWHPGLAAVVLFFGYAAVQKWRNAFTMCFGSMIGFAIPHFPWVLDPLGRQALIDAYLFHAGRGVTGESLIWQVLYPLGLTGMPTYAWADSPNLMAGPWPNLFAAVAIAVPILIATVKPHRAWATATIAPAMWLMANRIFSVQFVLTITVLWVVALLLYPRMTAFWRIILLISLAILNAANWMIWPIMDRGWPTYSAIVFIFLVPITITLWVVCGYKEKAIHKAGRHAMTAPTDEEPAPVPTA